MQAKDRSLGLCAAARVVKRARHLLGIAALLLASVAGLAQVPPTPGRVIVSDVLIQGNRLSSTESIKNQMKTRAGKEFVAEVLQDDIRALYKTGQFGNIWADKQDDGPGKVRVIVYIRDYPNVVKSVEYKGNRTLTKDDLDGLTNLRQGSPLNPVANKVACRRIIQKYNEDGRPFASCDLIKGGDPADTEVIFNITEGPRTRIASIGFTGNKFVDTGVLKNRINSSSKILFFGGQYNPAMTENDVHELMKYYRSFGFHDVKVNRELKYSPDGRDVDVVFHIVEGVQYKLSNQPRVIGVKSLPAETLEAMNKVKSGDTYKQSDIDGDIARIRDYLGYTGREVRVAATPVFSRENPGVMQVMYEVMEQPPARVGQVFVVGNERTRQNVILRQVPLYPGQVLTYPDIRQGERNLARLGIFETSPDGAVRPTITVLDNPLNPDSEFKDILVSIQEASTGSLMFGVGVNSDSGLTGSIVFNERNFDITRLPNSFDDLISGGAFRGAGQEFRLELVPGTQLQRYVASFREPFLFDTAYSLTTSGFFYQRFFNEYTEDRLGGRVTVGRKLDDFWSAGVTARVENVKVREVQPWAPADYLSVVGNNLLAGFRGNLTRDSRDSLLRPTDGFLLDLSAEQVFGDRTFTMANADYSQYFTVFQRPDGSGKQVLALHGQLGWASNQTPVFERFFGGGFRSIRGFEFRGVGPDVNGFKVGGNFMALASAEYQIPVRANDQIFMVGFVDTGTVSPKIDDIDTYRVSAGFGLRFVVPMLGPVPIALDFGFPIVKAKTDREQVFNFFMGFTR